MQTISRLLSFFGVFGLLSFAFAQPAPQFKVIGAGFIVHGISGDGNTLVGEVNGKPAAWNTTHGLYMLNVTAPYDHGYAADASSDGTVIVGTTIYPGNDGKASVWRRNARDDYNGGSILAVSNDGQNFPINTNNVVWHSPTREATIPVQDVAQAISGDGKVVAGAPKGFIWDSSGNLRQFSSNFYFPFVGALTLSGDFAYAIEKDYNNGHDQDVLYYWEEIGSGNVKHRIREFANSSAYENVVTAVADDNSIASATDLVYVPKSGTVTPLVEILTAQGVDTSGYSAFDIRSISSDGLILCGTALNSSNVRVSWRTALGLYGQSDTYKVVPDQSFNVPIPGVLSNDPYVFNASTVLVDQAQHGTVALNQYGGFVYTPNANFIGRDTFTYKLSKNGKTSNPITVVLKVGVPLSITLTPSGVAGGGKVSAKVILNFIPSSPVQVAVSSSKPSVVTMPSSVTVPAGQRYTSFAIQTARVSETTATTISATLSTVSVSASLTIGAYSPATVSFTPSKVTGTLNATGHVTLWRPAPAGGLTVSLSSSDRTVARPPASVVVPAGAQSFDFTVKTFEVPAEKAVLITAAGGNGSASAPLTVKRPALTSLTLTPSTVGSGNSFRATVQLEVPVAYDYIVKFSNGSAFSFTGSSFERQMYAPYTDTQTLTVPIRATGQDGSIVSQNLTVTPANLTGVRLEPPVVTSGGSLKVSGDYDGYPDSNATTTFTSSNTTVVPTPPSIKGNGSSTVTTNPVSSDVNVTITATYKGVTKSGTVTIKAAVIDSFFADPSRPMGGTTSQGTVVLNGKAGPGGSKITLSSSDTAVATVPASITVPSGSTSVNFTITTKSVQADTSVTIFGTFAGKTKSIQLVVTP